MAGSRGKIAAPVIGLALLAACASHPSEAPSETTSAPLRVSPAFDLASLASRTRHAFRADGNGFAAADTTFEAKVLGASIDIAPRRADLTRDASSLTIATSKITRGGAVIAIGSERDRAVEHDGSLTIARGPVSESITTSAEGVEQSWMFGRAPAGTGDLVVRVATSGQSYASSTVHGLHFGAVGSAGLRYGTATWVDARGHRTVVSPRFEHGEIVLTVPAETVSGSSYPAVLDPTIGAEREADQPISGSSASGDQYSPAIVSAGNNRGYLAVWYDRRGVRPALYGARISTTGLVQDDTGIPIATGVGSTTPSVAASDAGFLVTWSVSYVDLYQAPGVYAVRLDAQARPVDTVPLTLVANQTNLQLPAAAWDGAGWFLAWQVYGGATGYDIQGLHIGADGTAAQPTTPIVISNAIDQEYSPVVTFDGTNHFVTWRSYTNIYGRKYGKDGKPVTDRLTLVTSASGDLYNYGIAFDGTQHLLVWSDYGPSSLDIFGKRISIAGTPIDFGSLAISTSAADYDDRPRAAWDGTDFMVTFQRGSSLGAARLSQGGVLLDAPTIVSPVSTTNYFYDYSLASDHSSVVAVSRSLAATGSTGYDVSGLVINRTLALGATSMLVSKAANSETEPVTAWNGAKYASVWLDTRDGRPAIYGTTLDAGGQPSANDVKLVSDATRFPSELTRPRIAASGDGWLVVFYANDAALAKRGVWGLRLDANGQPDGAGIFPVFVPTSPTNLYEYATEPDVAFDGDQFLVVWQDEGNDGTTSIEGIHVPKTGVAILDKEPLHITAATPVDTRTVPSVAFDGQNYFVAWITSRPTAAGGIQVSHVYGSRVSKDGSVLEGEQAVCNAFLLQRAPFVAGDKKNGGFMVVWEDYRTALETADVYGARISAAGENLDGTSGMKIAAGDYDESRPRVSASGDGTNFVVAWRDLRSKSTYDIYGAWISLAGKSHDPQGLSLSAEAGDEDAPWVTAQADGNLLLSYQRLDPRSSYGSYRARMRTVTGGAAVAAACAKDDDCASRSCVDGVCCYTECGGCGTCSATPGTCTARPSASEAASCPNYKCQGTLACPDMCATDAECASNATCDPSTKKCVSRVICIDDETLKDLTGKTTDCAPFKCTADACRTQCGSVDDCATGFVCDVGGRCVQAPGANDGGCAVTPMDESTSAVPILAFVSLLASGLARRRSRPQIERA